MVLNPQKLTEGPEHLMVYYMDLFYSVQLAYAVDHDSYGLIFGFNTFLSLVLMTILTLTVADEHGLDLDIRTQVWIYSCS